LDRFHPRRYFRWRTIKCVSLRLKKAAVVTDQLRRNKIALQMKCIEASVAEGRSVERGARQIGSFTIAARLGMTA
jgi:hypothetical protein